MFDLRLSLRGTSVSARWLLALGVALAGCNADHDYCRVFGNYSQPGTFYRASRCAVARTAEEVCQGLQLPTPAPAMLVYQTAGPYSQREVCEERGDIDISRPPADAGRP
jgi:hypothetical protein